MLPVLQHRHITYNAITSLLQQKLLTLHTILLLTLLLMMRLLTLHMRITIVDPFNVKPQQGEANWTFN